MSKKFILLITVVVAGSLFVLRHLEEINTGQVVEIIVLTTLVLLTAVYVKELREQRLSEAQPYLLLRLADEAIQWHETELGKPTEFSVIIRNEGKGPARNLWAALWHPIRIYFGDRKGYLAQGEEWQTTISRTSTHLVEMGIKKKGWLPKLGEIVKQDKPGIVAVKCEDIHQRTWVSYLYLEWDVDLDGYVMEGEQSIVELHNND